MKSKICSIRWAHVFPDRLSKHFWQIGNFSEHSKHKLHRVGGPLPHQTAQKTFFYISRLLTVEEQTWQEKLQEETTSSNLEKKLNNGLVKSLAQKLITLCVLQHQGGATLSCQPPISMKKTNVAWKQEFWLISTPGVRNQPLKKSSLKKNASFLHQNMFNKKIIIMKIHCVFNF